MYYIKIFVISLTGKAFAVGVGDAAVYVCMYVRKCVTYVRTSVSTYVRVRTCVRTYVCMYVFYFINVFFLFYYKPC